MIDRLRCEGLCGRVPAGRSPRTRTWQDPIPQTRATQPQLPSRQAPRLSCSLTPATTSKVHLSTHSYPAVSINHLGRARLGITHPHPRSGPGQPNVRRSQWR